MKFLR